MNSPQHIHGNRSRDEPPNEMAQQPADELIEVETTNLVQVASGSDSATMGLGKN